MHQIGGFKLGAQRRTGFDVQGAGLEHFVEILFGYLQCTESSAALPTFEYTVCTIYVRIHLRKRVSGLIPRHNCPTNMWTGGSIGIFAPGAIHQGLLKSEGRVYL